MALWDRVAEAITEATGERFEPVERGSVGGGCINEAARIESADGRRYFVKLNRADRLDMFEAEFEGLAELAAPRALHVPEPVAVGTAEGRAFLVMEYIPLGGGGAGAALGEGLAALHRTTRPRFGWHRDNTIGSTPQVNTETDDWVEFWRRHRLGFQLDLAARKGHRGRLQRLGGQLLERFPALFTDYSPRPSLLHGDLWGGNWGTDTEGRPVIFDPAVYYGDREADLAMTELFGGFGPDFYAAYRAAWPLDPGYPVRKTLYNLYHILNHLNLFGGGYGSQAEHMMERLLAELRG
jgi:fructosamine-3-kinase